MVVDTATGAVAQQLTYDAFGRVLTDTAPGFTPFGYAGGLLDLDTGLVRFGARDCDPETGRWTTQDPIGLGGGDANLYAYVANDPVNGIDPSGLAIAGNPAMDSALGGGFLAALGFDTFAQGMANYQLGMLELSNEATFNQGLRDIRQGICQMVAGGIGLGTSTGPMAMAAVPLLPALTKTTVTKMISLATTAGRSGASPVGRAIQKHAARPGSWLTKFLTTKHEANTRAGTELLKEVWVQIPVCSGVAAPISWLHGEFWLPVDEGRHYLPQGGSFAQQP